MWRSLGQGVQCRALLRNAAHCTVSRTIHNPCSWSAAVLGQYDWSSLKVLAQQDFCVGPASLAAMLQVTEEFLEYTKSRGNDLSTPRPPSFPGLKPGDRWCLCVSRCTSLSLQSRVTACCLYHQRSRHCVTSNASLLFRVWLMICIARACSCIFWDHTQRNASALQ